MASERWTKQANEIYTTCLGSVPDAFADALESAYRAGLERAGEIATNHRAAVPPECVSEVEKYGREIADAIRKEAGK